MPHEHDLPRYRDNAVIDNGFQRYRPRLTCRARTISLQSLKRIIDDGIITISWSNCGIAFIFNFFLIFYLRHGIGPIVFLLIHVIIKKKN